MLPKSCVALAILCCAAPLPAIVIRHDVDDKLYRANEADFPFLFALYRTKAGHRDCVATLVARQWAVTAEHCTQDRPFVDGLSKPSPGYAVQIGGSPFEIDRVERHPPAPDGRKIDLALLHLSQPVPQGWTIHL